MARHDRVKRTVTAGSAEHAAAAAAQKKGGLDNVLAAIDGPKSISTVSCCGSRNPFIAVMLDVQVDDIQHPTLVLYNTF